MPNINRRTFLRTGIAGSVLLSTGQTRARAAARSERGSARNVIFLVTDGMSHGTLALADRYLEMHEGRGSSWLSLYSRQDVRRALMDTASANSIVTDSAAASSAWGCGQRINNGAVNMAPDGSPLTPILHLARDAGLGTGLVTTATITHATPAGFAAQVPSRNDEPTIARQYLEAEIQVLLGGGARHFDPSEREDGRDLFSEYARSGYAIARDSDSLSRSADDDRVLGVFANGHLPYSLDQNNDPALKRTVPTLTEMMRDALARLDRNSRGFVLQVEAARVDHAAHANDVGGLVHDQIAFEDAVAEAVAFTENRDDTLVIVTTDHGNANPALNAEYGRFGGTEKCFERLEKFKHTNSWILRELSERSRPGAIRDRVEEATGIALAGDDVDILRRALRERHRDAYHVRSPASITLGQLLSNHVSVGWSGVSHTTDHVELAAFGPGSEEIPGFVQNHALFGVMTAAVGIS